MMWLTTNETVEHTLPGELVLNLVTRVHIFGRASAPSWTY